MTWAVESTLASCEMSQFYSGCWKMKNRSKIFYTCHSLFSATFPSFSKLSIGDLEMAKTWKSKTLVGSNQDFGRLFKRIFRSPYQCQRVIKFHSCQRAFEILWQYDGFEEIEVDVHLLWYSISSGPWPKKEDWLKKKDRDQRRPGCRRLKARVSSMQGPYHLVGGTYLPLGRNEVWP